MRTKINYEWAIETVENINDEDPDIIDISHSDRLERLPEHSENERLVLVRDVREPDNFDNLIDRHWAYVTGGALPAMFEESAHKVPQRFHKELARFS